MPGEILSFKAGIHRVEAYVGETLVSVRWDDQVIGPMRIEQLQEVAAAVAAVQADPPPPDVDS